MYLHAIDDLIKNGSKKMTISKFLTIEEQKQLTMQSKVNVIFCSNYEGEIRKKAIVFPKGNASEEIEQFDFKIAFLKVSYDKRFGEIKHPQVLGSVLSLGLSRESIGDIIINDDIYIIVSKELTLYIINNLFKINNISVDICEVEGITNEYVPNYDKEKIIIPSLRLDCVVAKAINTSREKAKVFILNKLVRVNGIININNDCPLKEKDVISITKNGRIIINEILGSTKKDKVIIEILKTK